MATEANNWPRWLQDIWPNWLEDIGYPHPGVGDLSDLKLSLGVGQDGRWIGFVNTGWYYHTQYENYNYTQVGTILLSGFYNASGSVTTSPSFRPTWGPIIVNGVVDDASGRNDGPYREHHNSFSPATTLTWTAVSSAASAYLQATIPVSAILINLRDTTDLPLGSVAGTGLVSNNKLYYYDLTNRLVYIRPTDPSDFTPDVWADILYTYPILRFREIVVSDKDASGNPVLLPSYNHIRDVKTFRGGYTTIVSGSHASGFITHALTGVNKGDWVVLDYWIDKSFVLSNHDTLEFFVGGPVASSVLDWFTINYETSVPDVAPNITVNVPLSGIYRVFNVNPLFEFGYRVGYLFHGSPASGINSYWTASTLKMYTDKDTVCSSWAELLKVKLLVTGSNDLPIPYYPVTVVVSGGSAITKLPDGKTDGRGEVHYIIRPDATGTSVITVLASCGTLSASASITVVASSTLITADRWHDGFVNIVITNDRTGRGGFRSYATASMADGLPRDNTTHLVSKLASEFYTESDSTLTQKITLGASVNVPNIQALTEFGYVPQPNDSLFGYSNTAISKIIKGEV